MSESSTEIYSSDGSLRFSKGEFTLDGRPFRVLSGAFHYFRTLPVFWTDRLLKLKACGLNTVETYVPWNLHEEYQGQFNFTGILDVRKFIQTAKDVGLHVIFRPGPYICSEWDFGGLPAWLLSDPNMKVRSNYHGYVAAVERYFNKLLPLVVDLQHSNGGPIIAFQVENEFGSYSSNVEHLLFIKQLFIKQGLKELFLTSDNLSGMLKDVFYQEALPTANFKEFKEGRVLFDQIHNWSREFPLMVTEFWTGWFDHWTSKHDGLSVPDYASYLEDILKANASVNFYMFHGGTNFGFMNGANKFEGSTYKPDVSSYDYDALLTEAGDITPKYNKTRELLLEHVLKEQGITSLPDIPGNSQKTAYGAVQVEAFLSFEDMLKTTPVIKLQEAVPMEMLKLHGNYGQNYGYILYRTEIPAHSKQLLFTDLPKDRAQIFVDGKQVAMMDWKTETLNISIPATNTSENVCQLDILVENHGRVNYATEESNILNQERKGISGSVMCDNNKLEGFCIHPLEFKSEFVSRKDWSGNTSNLTVPGLFKTSLQINSDPNDTYVFMQGWGKGIVFVNGFNLGRYWSAGPQQTLYIPAPVLKQGDNEIVFFEQETLGQDVVFLDRAILDVNDPTSIKI